MRPWLTDDELRDLTGYVRTSHQARWLADNRIRFFINGLNKVRVPRDAVAGITPAAAKPRRTEPDFTKVRRVG